MWHLPHACIKWERSASSRSTAYSLYGWIAKHPIIGEKWNLFNRLCFFSLSLSLCTIQRLKCRVSIHLYISFFYLFVIVHSLVSNWLERHESHAHDGSFRFWTGGMVHGAQLTDKQPLRPENVKIEPARACTHIQMSNAAQWKLVMHTEKRTYPNEWPGEWHRTKIVKSQIVSNRNWLNFLICSLSPPPYVDFSLMLHMEK